MPPLKVELVSTIFTQCAPIFLHRTSPHAFFRATRSLPWASGRARRSRSWLASEDKADTSKRAQLAGTEHDLDTINTASLQDPEDRVTINLLEKDEGSDAEPQPVDLGEVEDFEKELAQQEKDIDDRIASLEADMDYMKLPKASEEFANLLFSPEQRASIMANLERNFERIGELPHRLFIWERLPESSRIFLDNFNASLDSASMNPASDKARVESWRWYSRCKIYLPGFLSNIPDAAWEIMWLSQSEDKPSNSSRASHRQVLANDMITAGRTLTQDQRYGRIEGMFLDGQESKGLEEWENALTYGPGDSGNPEFLELGIRMYMHHGNLARAEDLLDVLFKLHQTYNPRIMIPFMSASLAKENNEGYRTAQTLYVRLKQRLGTDMTMQDYDTAALAFLAAGHKDFALAVFKDMMLSGDAASRKSYSLIKKVQERLGAFASKPRDADEVSDSMLSAMTYLPKQYQNKFFYAKWLRKLISMGETDAAAQVVELMYERGVNPDAQHVNGLIGAWLRVDTAETRKKAEDMAWNMIQTRLDLVHNRKLQPPSGTKIQGRSVHDNKEAGVNIRSWIARPTPAGTIETFCILVKYYLENEMFENVRHLRDLLFYAELPMNSVFMNHVLYAELSYRDHRDVWARFEVMSRSVLPDVETWICLWECMKFELSNSANPDAIARNEKHSFPTPRKLFGRMIQWSASLEGRNKRDALDDMEIDTYNDILRCFCLSRDLTGAFIAVRSMTNHFDIWPTPATIRMLVMQISKMSTQRNREGRKWRQPRQNDMEDKMNKTTEALNLISQFRRKQLVRKGADFDRLSEHQQAEESLRTIMQFLHTVVSRRQDRTVPFQGLLDHATSEMGIESMIADDMMALVV